VKGLRASAKGQVSFIVENSNAFPIEVLSVDLKTAPAAGRPARRKPRRGRKPITVASLKPGTRVAAGSSSRLSVRLNRRGIRLLGETGRLPVEIGLRVSAPDGSQAAVNGRGILKAASGHG
jgi:hypothetical protein